MSTASADGEKWVSHLLRHLHDSTALRRNALVCSLFRDAEMQSSNADRDAIAHIREVVSRIISQIATDPAIGKHRKRCSQIIDRCDLQRESHKNVAASMGICMRQFYRERLIARRYFAQRLPRLLRASETAPQTRHERFSFVQARITALRDAGASYEALRYAQHTSHSHADPMQRLLATIGTADILVDCGRISEAADVVRDAWIVGERTGGTKTFMNEIKARLLSVSARVRWESGYCAKALEDDQRNEALLQSLETSGDLYQRAFCIGAHLERSWRRLSGGQLKFARDEADRAGALLDSLHEKPPRIVADVLTSHSAVETLKLPSSPPFDTYARALQICNDNHLSEMFVRTIIARSVAQELSGQPAAALAQLHGVLPELHNSCSPLVYGAFLLRTAELETAVGRGLDALEHLDEARPFVFGSAFASLAALLIQASAQVSLCAFGSALRTSRRAQALAQMQGNIRFQGAALRLNAECLSAMGQPRLARRRIAISLRLLQTSGHTYSLIRASQTRDRIGSGS